jgi:hypothetical protein
VITAPGAFAGPGPGQTFPSSVLVDWNDVAGAVGYDVIIGTTESNQVVRVTDSQYTLPSVVIGTQTMRVRAVLSNGEISEATSHTFISVAAPQNLSVSEFPLEQAIRVSMTDQSFSVLPNGNSAIVHILDGETNAPIKSEQVFFPAGATREVRVGLLFTQVPGHHRLIVKVNSSGASAPGTSTAFTMRTRSLDATFNTATNVTLTWPAVARVLNYDVWVDDDIKKIRSFVQAPNLTTNSYTGNFPASTYRAWVRARFANGSVTLWSIASGFTTGGTMRLMNPSGTILDNKGDELFVLSEVKDAAGYEIWVNNVTTGTRVLHDDSIPVVITSWLPPTSLGPGHYAAWARPKLAGNTPGPWSPVRNFTIQASRQIAVRSPGGPVFDWTPDVAWQTVPWATSYTLYLAAKGSSTAVYRVTLPATASSHTVTASLVDGDYDVWVQARGANGLISPWGAATLMTIEVKPPHSRSHLPLVILVTEVGGPGDGTDVEWLLLTTLPISTFDEVLRVIDYYVARWTVEVYLQFIISEGGSPGLLTNGFTMLIVRPQCDYTGNLSV